MTESSIAVQLKYIAQRVDEVNKDVKELTNKLVSKEVHNEQIEWIRKDILEIKETSRYRTRITLWHALSSFIAFIWAVIWAVMTKLF